MADARVDGLRSGRSASSSAAPCAGPQIRERNGRRSLQARPWRPSERLLLKPANSSRVCSQTRWLSAMLIRAAMTAATPCQMIACVTLAKSWNSWDVSFPLRPMPHPFSNTGSRGAPTLPTIRLIPARARRPLHGVSPWRVAGDQGALAAPPRRTPAPGDPGRRKRAARAVGAISGCASLGEVSGSWWRR